MPTASKLNRQARNGAHKVRAVTHKIKRVARRDSNRVVQAFQNMGGDVAHAIKDGYDDLRDSAVHYVDSGRNSAEREVKQHPLTALLIATGFGFLAGLLVRRH